ncbi:hypothetical protein [Streptomyces thermoalcalitolerans]|uniref:Uncharacterized protein n=1 Tax=Streptomyces thermoalcalitolerans TaxID=65605 RepID=A0ABP3ZZW4_9ACTN
MPGAVLFLAVFGLLTAAVPAAPAVAVPNPPLRPMTAANPDAFSLGGKATGARRPAL